MNLSGDSNPLTIPTNDFKLVNKNLQDPDRNIRQAALKCMLDHCQKIENLSETEANEIYDTFYLALLQCYADKYENVRNAAIEVMTMLVKHLSTNSYYIECIVPVIAKRLGSDRTEIIEESEEIRLVLLQQIFVIVTKFHQCSEGTNYLANVYNDIMDILRKCLPDSFPDVQRECCAIIQVLATATPTFHMRSTDLVNRLILMLRHRQLANRISAIQALGVVALHINGNGETIIKIIQSISPLLMDSIQSVRLECGRVGCKWLLHLRDRYSFFERLVPLALCW